LKPTEHDFLLFPAMLCCCGAVTRFARETGDIAALSSVDIKLLALAHTLEVAAHGSQHLAAHASQVGSTAAQDDTDLQENSVAYLQEHP
jgi:rRNA maturation endonuclease Nob1